MKTWQAPKLVILTRSNPEEVLLTGCKTMFGETGSPTVYFWKCDRDTGCYECELAVSS